MTLVCYYRIIVSIFVIVRELAVISHPATIYTTVTITLRIDVIVYIVVVIGLSYITTNVVNLNFLINNPMVLCDFPLPLLSLPLHVLYPF